MRDLSPKGINEQFYNVKAFGALGDNSTADHVAIQAALDAAWNAGGGEVVVPKGIYRIMNVPLKIRSNVKLTCLPGAEIHRYHDFSSMVWNGDFSQNGIATNRAGWLNHGDITVEGGVWDMRCTTATNALCTDTFTRSNTSAPHTLGATTTGGLTWIDETSRGSGDTTNGGSGAGTNGGNIGIVSNTAFIPFAATSVSSVYAWPDGTVKADVATTGTVGEAGVVFRLQDSQNYWKYVRDNVTGNAKMTYTVNSVETTITPSATQAVSAGNTLTVVMFGNRIRAYVGSTLTHDTADLAGFTANRKVGLILTDTTSRLDNFSSVGSMWADSFDRTNSAVSLTNTSSNYTWTQQSGTLGINTNLAYAPGAGTNIATVDATSETNVDVKVTTVDATGAAGVVFRYQDANNYWWYRRHTDGNARLSKFVGGVETVITASNTTAVVANDVLSVKIMGWKINCFINYTAASFEAGTGTSTNFTHSTSDSALYQASKVGIRIDGTTARLDNFDCYAATGGYLSGACFNFGHGENILFRDFTIRDTSSKSHGIEIAGCKNVLVDNVVFQGMAPVTGRTSEAFQMDITKGSGYFGAFGPHDNTTNRDVVVRESSFIASGMPGTQAWDRGVGSHTSTIGVWHDHLRVTDCFFEVTQKAVRAYNWNNVFVKGNTIRTGSGIEVRVVDITDSADTINLAGTTTSLAQAISNISIEGNILTCDVAASGTVAAIHVIGLTSGHASGVTIRGNDIRSTTCGGIYTDFSDNNIVESNTVNSLSAADTGFHGIRINSCNEVLVTGNQAFRTSGNGIYITGGSTSVRAIGNFVKGGNRANSTNSAFKSDGTCDELTFIANCFRLYGSGTEPQYGLHVSNGTNMYHSDNDLDAGSVGTWNVVPAGEIGPIIQRTATATTALPTATSTAVTGLSMTLPLGTWLFKAWVPIVNAGSPNPTNTQVTISGPTVSGCRWTATIHGTSVLSTFRTSFGVSSQTVASNTTNHTLVYCEGTCTVTTAGTLSVAITPTVGAGGTQTAQIGSYLRAERLTS